MITFGFALVGILLGLRTARQRNGTGLDMAQYGAGFGIAFAILGLFVAIGVRSLAG